MHETQVLVSSPVSVDGCTRHPCKMRHLLHQPLVLTVLCFPVCMVLVQRWRPERGTVGRWLWRVALFFLVVGITGPILCAGRHMIYHDEPTVIAVAAAELHGQPLYHAADAGDRYSVLYGPMVFWVYVPPMLAHIVDLRVYQIWVGLPLLFAGLIVFRIVRRAGSHFGSGLALLPYTVTVFIVAANEWAMKGDAWMLLFFSLELQLALVLPANAAVVAVAVAASLLINVKATAVCLACVPMAILGRRLGGAKALQAGLLAAVFTALPFLVPGVSARHYIYWLRTSSRHGIDLHMVAGNTALMIFMALPVSVLLCLLVWWERTQTLRWLGQHRIVILVSVTACLVLVVTGAKVGAGPWHCAPMAPLFAWFTAVLWRRCRELPLLVQPLPRAFLATAVLSQLLVGALALRSGVVVHWRGDYPASHTVPGRLLAQDLASIVRAYPRTQIQMGYGDDETYEMTWQRPILVLLGNHYSLDADNLNEMEFAGIGLPEATLAELRTCRSRMYLIPKGAAPFSMHSLYYLGGATAPKLLFPESFRQEFFRSYQKSGSSRYFDLWSCRH